MSRAKISVASLVLLVACSSAQTQAPSLQELLSEGLDVYAGAQSFTDQKSRTAAFERAHRLFIEAAARGADNAEVYANAGTAALRAEKLGAAIVAFKRALARDPDNTRSQQNLAQTRQLLPAWVPKPSEDSVLDTFFFWHRSFSTTQRSGVAALAFLIAALTLALSLRWPNVLVRGLAVVTGLIWASLLASVLIDTQTDTQPHAVVIVPETLARASDSINAPAQFAAPLPEGTELRIIEQRPGWTRIQLANNREAWVQRSALAVVSE